MKELGSNFLILLFKIVSKVRRLVCSDSSPVEDFQLPPFLSNDSQPFIFFSCSIFLVNPLPTGVYSICNPLILDGFLKFWCFSLDFARMDTKTPSFLSYDCCRFLVRIRVFMLYNFSYLHLGPHIFFSSYN